MASSKVLDRLIKVAFQNPDYRDTLLPVIQQLRQRAADLSDVDVEEGKMHKILNLDEDQTISEYGSPAAAARRIVDEVGEQEAAGMINWAANISGDEFLKRMQEELKNID